MKSMKTKLRLILGREMDAPFANSIPVLLLIAALFIAGSLLLWSDAGDTLFLRRESAQVVEATVESAAVVGEESYVPRLEIVTAEGETYTLLKSQVGDLLKSLAAELEPGDEIRLRLSRKGNVLEVQEGSFTHLDFDQSKKSALGDVFISGGTALIFDLLAVFLIVRCAILRMNRKGGFHFGPAQ